MKIDLDQFSGQGYLVLSQVIPPDQLDELRARYERLVDRQLIGNLIFARSILGNNREIIAQGRHGGPGQ